MNDSKSKCCISSAPAKSVRFVRKHCSPGGCDSKSKWACEEIKFWLFSHQEKIGRYGRNIHFLHPGCIFRWSVKHLRRNHTRLSFVFPGIEFLIPSDSSNWMVIAFTIKLPLIPISIMEVASTTPHSTWYERLKQAEPHADKNVFRQSSGFNLFYTQRTVVSEVFNEYLLLLLGKR